MRVGEASSTRALWGRCFRASAGMRSTIRGQYCAFWNIIGACADAHPQAEHREPPSVRSVASPDRRPSPPSYPFIAPGQNRRCRAAKATASRRLCTASLPRMFCT